MDEKPILVFKYIIVQHNGTKPLEMNQSSSTVRRRKYSGVPIRKTLWTWNWKHGRNFCHWSFKTFWNAMREIISSVTPGYRQRIAQKLQVFSVRLCRNRGQAVWNLTRTAGSATHETCDTAPFSGLFWSEVYCGCGLWNNSYALSSITATFARKLCN